MSLAIRVLLLLLLAAPFAPAPPARAQSAETAAVITGLKPGRCRVEVRPAAGGDWKAARPPHALTAGAPTTRPISGLHGPARATRCLFYTSQGHFLKEMPGSLSAKQAGTSVLHSYTAQTSCSALPRVPPPTLVLLGRRCASGPGLRRNRSGNSNLLPRTYRAAHDRRMGLIGDCSARARPVPRHYAGRSAAGAKTA